jgi:hypothetical protein
MTIKEVLKLHFCIAVKDNADRVLFAPKSVTNKCLENILKVMLYFGTCVNRLSIYLTFTSRT